MKLSKDELLKTIQTNLFAFCREKYFKKNFPENYQEINSLEFPSNFTFNQKLFHYIYDPLMSIGYCKVCGKPTRFKGFGQGYSTYCSSNCLSKDDTFKQKISDNWNNLTNEEKENINNKKHIWWKTLSEKERDFIINKRKSSWSKKSKDEINNMISKIKETWNSKTLEELEEIRNKKSATVNKKTEKERHLIIEKVYSTKRKNNTFNTSSVEDLFEKYLYSKQYEYIRQYKDKNRYPFLCDFYIPYYDLYIEIQGFWTHGKHPFDKNNSEDINLLNYWHTKNTPQYNKAIYNWSQRDVLKRNVAKEHNLNYLEIFSDKIDVVIKEFNEYLKRVG